MEQSVLDKAWITPGTPTEPLALDSLGFLQAEEGRNQATMQSRGKDSQAGVAVLYPFPSLETSAANHWVGSVVLGPVGKAPQRGMTEQGQLGSENQGFEPTPRTQ